MRHRDIGMYKKTKAIDGKYLNHITYFLLMAGWCLGEIKD